jgi:hypothetical protein
LEGFGRVFFEDCEVVVVNKVLNFVVVVVGVYYYKGIAFIGFCNNGVMMFSFFLDVFEGAVFLYGLVGVVGVFGFI